MKKHYLTSLNELFEISLKRRKQFRGWLLMPFLGTRPLITIIIVLRWFVLGVAWHIVCVFRCCWKRFAAAYVFPKTILLFVSVLCEIFMTRDQQISNAKFHINKAIKMDDAADCQSETCEIETKLNNNTTPSMKRYYIFHFERSGF